MNVERHPHRLTSVPLTDVEFRDVFWAPRIETNRSTTLNIEYEQCKKTGRIDAWRWRAGRRHKPHIFWDSDVAKWIEAAAYSLATRRDRGLERRIDAVVEMMAEAQGADGYLNSHFQLVEPEKRWSNLRDWHELYCAGHLMEAGVAYEQATGKRKLVDVMCRYADYIGKVFGRGPGQLRGYPGHEEIELALVKLYRATGREGYLRLSKFFIDERGKRPHYFDIEARRRGEGPESFWARSYAYNQSHVPVREQAEVVGHAVRACYLYAGMADVAAETGDKTLLRACRRLWRNLTERRMYITGGIGPTAANEGFTVDYDLPNESGYAETCAAIALVFWAHRMLHLEADARYADVMERALYNGVLSGVSLDGQRFFYANPLTAYPGMAAFTPPHVTTKRQAWFGCACCPPNIARLIASLPGYAYSQSKDAAWIHLYAAGEACVRVGDHEVTLRQRTRYPWDGRVRISVHPEAPSRFTLALRIPGWSRGATLKVNARGVRVDAITTGGYAKIERRWTRGDTVALNLPMPVERVEAHPRVRQDCGCVALQRGPIVYCLEEVDNGRDLGDIALPAKARLRARMDRGLLGGVVVITGEALRRDGSVWGGELYRAVRSKPRRVGIKAIPYCVWANRAEGEMLVWIREA
ncbi:MAG: glycoside hydrolase family 127 protein [Phycisphaerae bacterium]|nr:glycoside hydrolase family 127 protein [Phycisphaerae bacterium]